MKDVIKCMALVSALLSIHNMNADTNDTYTVQDMFQTVVTPTEFSTTQSQHNQLPDIHTMPKLDKEALYLFYKELLTERHEMNLILRKLIKERNIRLTWGDITYSKYDDDLLEFRFIVKDPQSGKECPTCFFQDKKNKIYENIPPKGERTKMKQWHFDKFHHDGTIIDYKNHIKWSGNISYLCSDKKNTLEYTESSEKEGRKLDYNYKAEFTESKTPYGEELKFKSTHVSTVNGKSGKPIVTETVYKGELLPLLKELGLYKGVLPLPIKTFKTVRD